MSTEIVKPSLPGLVWGNQTVTWGEDGLVWGASGYSTIDKPSGQTETDNFLLINATDFLAINDDGDELITGVDSESIYSEITKPSIPSYSEIIKPV